MNKHLSSDAPVRRTTALSEETRAALRVLGAWALRAADKGEYGDNPDRLVSAQSEPRLLTIPEVSAQLRLSKWSVYQLIHECKLASVKVGARRFVPASELDRFVAGLIDRTGGHE
ncbi:helix-turn-helix transcriptional regulator [Nocardia farcinica]|uniref:helix-turn-helix transcriptional regulator n=1 Tax=Nocardia farcinica TaxID=37329 RepID=UPI00245403DB|nr:helix-turn-helix domain-containing protein [Nocardia farcinica]